ncbi:hypothetical protein ACQPW3_35675 [Actinosynnema sp. CA-248983]
MVLPSGELVLGRLSPAQGHVELAQRGPVAAAGEFKVVAGRLKWIDNRSGHYLPFGSVAGNVAEEAFERAGWDADGRYEEKW